MQTYTDEQLVAYTDGELAAGEAQRIKAAAQNDAPLAARIARFTESRRILASTFATHLEAPVPQRLLDALQIETGGKVIPFRKSARPAWSRGSHWMPTALAASLALAVGLGAGGLLDRRSGNSGNSGLVIAGLMPDAAALGRALETLPSGEALIGASDQGRFEIVPLASLQTQDETFCREFESSVATQTQTRRARGVACRAAGGTWEMRAVASVSGNELPPAADGSFQTASGAGMDFTAVLQNARRLTPEEERVLIEREWKSGR